MARNGIPAGYETNSDDDDDLYFAGEEKPKRLTLWDVMKHNPKPDYVQVDWPTACKEVEPRKGFINLCTVEGENFEPEENDHQEKHDNSNLDPIVFLDQIRVSAVNGNLEYIKQYLVKVGVDVRLKNDWTCLQWAAASAQPEVVQYCLENGADPNQHKGNVTVLMNAILATIGSEGLNNSNEINIVSCIEKLVKYGARINERDMMGTSALSYATKKNRSKVVAALIDLGADINQGDQFMYSPIHVAALFGLGAMIELLIKKGAMFDIKTLEDESIANVAFKRGHDDLGFILDELLDGGELTDEISEKLQRFKPFNTSLLDDDGSELDNFSENSDSREPNYKIMKEERIKQSGQVTGDNDLDVEERLYQAHLREFLYDLELKHLVEMFESKKLNFLDMLFFDDADLQELGLSIVERRKILFGLKRFHQTPWSRLSLPNLRGTTIDHYEVANFVAHVTSQLNYTQASFDYLSRQIKKEFTDQEVFKKNVVKFVTEIDDCLDKIDAVDSAVSELDSTMEELKNSGAAQDGVNVITPDLIKDILYKIPGAYNEDIHGIYGDFNRRKSWIPTLIGLTVISAGSIFALKMLKK